MKGRAWGREEHFILSLFTSYSCNHVLLSFFKGRIQTGWSIGPFYYVLLILGKKEPWDRSVVSLISLCFKEGDVRVEHFIISPYAHYHHCFYGEHGKELHYFFSPCILLPSCSPPLHPFPSIPSLAFFLTSFSPSSLMKVGLHWSPLPLT